ncbi:MAG: 3-phosphoshikimate 1-carboxyvinyltransferase [Phycisphaerales bacterium JB038]
MTLPDPYPIEPLGAFRAKLTPPGSKSLTNRALLLAALADGESTVRNFLAADDTQRMMTALSDLGVPLQHEGALCRVQGGAGTLSGGGELSLGNAGTATRFLTAAACFAGRPVLLDGDARMRLRPIGELVDQLRQLGAKIHYLGAQGCPPLRVEPTGVPLRGGSLTVPTTLSSQFISALLMIGPLCDQGLTLNLTGPVTSASYIGMTVGIMRRFGAEVQVDRDGRHFQVSPGAYTACDYLVEPDASGATYFLAAAALTPGSSCTIEGLGKDSAQGDVALADALAQMGAGLAFGQDFIAVTGPEEPLQGIDVDMSLMPDAALTLAAVASCAEGPSVLRGLRTLRVKETDRLAALQTELGKLGVAASIEADGGDELLRVEPAGASPVTLQRGETADSARPVVIDTYNDHRMAMSFAVLGLRRPGLRIANPDCVNKTYPDFWSHLELLRAMAI